MPDGDIPDIQVDCVGSTVCPRCAATVDVSALGAFATARCPSCKTAFPAPGKIGQYVLLRQLSLSEIGATYRGFDTAMSRHVQVNVMRRALRQDKDKVSAFLAEARALAAIDHRTAARALFVGDEDGRPYSVTEWIEGPSLEVVLSAGKPVKEKRALEMGVELVGLLASAARIGLVHGDIRPGNIHITPKGKAKLVNFRFAGAGPRPPTANAAPVRKAYASPEHLAGRAVDSRSDVFSLGATLFHAVTGRAPFDDDRPRESADAPPPNARAVRAVLQQATAEVLAGMLQRDPDKRCGRDVSDLQARLRRALKLSRKAASARPARPAPTRPSAPPAAAPPGPAVAGPTRPAAQRPEAGAAAALARMRRARRGRRQRSAPRKPTRAGEALPVDVLPAEGPLDQTPLDVPMPVQLLPEDADVNDASIVDLLVEDEPPKAKPSKLRRSRRKLVAIASIVLVAAGGLIGVLAGVFGSEAGADPAAAPAGARPTTGPSRFRGKIGLGTYRTAADFKDVRVKRDWLTLFEADFATNAVAQWTPIAGEWKHRRHVYRQRDQGAANAFCVVGDASWSDYTLSLKARKIAGAEGFFIPFRWINKRNYFVWNIGGRGNTQHVVERVRKRRKPVNVCPPVNGRIEPDRWYEITIELTGPRIRCLLDGKVIHDIEGL